MNYKIVVDGHCDTLTALVSQNRTFGEKSIKGQLDLPRMLTGGVNVQFFAAFIAPKYKDMALKRCLQLIDLFYEEMKENQDIAQLALSVADIYRIVDSGKIAALLSIEGGEALASDIALLRIYYHLGVRSVTLTWNGRNDLGDGVGEGITAGGLSTLGRSVVQEMNRMGMLIDVSHLSEKGFWNVAKISQQPFAATHANCRALCNHPRNLTDEQIKYLAEAGGVVGLTYNPEFISREDPSLENLICHIDHIASRFGIECIALGSDFDGINNYLPELQDVTCVPHLAEVLIKRGYNYKEVSGIMGENWMKLLKRVLK